MNDELKNMILKFDASKYPNTSGYTSFEFHTSSGSEIISIKDFSEIKKRLENSVSLVNEINNILKEE